MLVEGRPSGSAGSGGRGDDDGWGGSLAGTRAQVVAADADEGWGELRESVAPGAEAVAENAEWVAYAAQCVTAMVVGSVGVVVDGPEQSGGAGTGVPPGLE